MGQMLLECETTNRLRIYFEADCAFMFAHFNGVVFRLTLLWDMLLDPSVLDFGIHYTNLQKSKPSRFIVASLK